MKQLFYFDYNQVDVRCCITQKIEVFFWLAKRFSFPFAFVLKKKTPEHLACCCGVFRF